MHIETFTEYTTTIDNQEVVLRVRHADAYTHTFYLRAGCVDEWLTVADLKELRNLCNAGLRCYSKVTK